MVTSLGYTRWDPRSRAGAVAVRRESEHDLRALEELSENVSDWAKYQDLSGDHDTVETCPVAGPYDWRSYIQEETKLAQRREAGSKPARKAEPANGRSAPSGYYA